MTDFLIKELEQMGKHTSVRLSTDPQVWKDAAALLRRQHEAIRVLREALTELSGMYVVHHNAATRAKKALKYTEEFQ